MLPLTLSFFWIGSVSFGGGMATVPFLRELSLKTQWFSLDDLSTIIALSSCTPGPIGVNMASYIGYMTHGLIGAFLASIALASPAFFLLFFLARTLEKKQDSPLLNGLFYGLTPASTALISAVFFNMLISCFDRSLDIQIKSLILFSCLALLSFFPKTKQLPIPILLLFSAVFGVLFKL